MSIAVWPWGTYLGEESLRNGVRMKVSSWRRMDPNVNPVAAKGTGIYINSSLAKVEAVKSGYDEAILLNTQGFVAECTGENVFIVKDGVLITPPLVERRARGHHARLGHDDRPRPRRTRCGRSSCSAHDLYLADEAFLTGTAAEVVPIRSVDDREIGEPRRDHPQAPGDVLRHRPRRGRALQGLVGVCPLTTCPQYATRAGRRASRSTTRRCATAAQLEGISLTVDDKLRIAEQLDWLGVDFIEAGWPGANPKDDEFFRRAPQRAARSTRARSSRSARPAGSKGKVDSDDTLRNLARRGHRRRCASSASAWDYHVLEALSTTLDEGVAMVADSVAFLHADGPRRVLRRRALLRRLPPQPRVRLRVLEGAAAGGRDAGSCSATRTAARCPHEVEQHRARGRRLLRRRRRHRASTSTTTPAPAWPTRSPACAAARSRCRARSTATASAPATATSPRSSRTSR